MKVQKSNLYIRKSAINNDIILVIPRQIGKIIIDEWTTLDIWINNVIKSKK